MTKKVKVEAIHELPLQNSSCHSAAGEESPFIESSHPT